MLKISDFLFRQEQETARCPDDSVVDCIKRILPPALQELLLAKQFTRYRWRQMMLNENLSSLSKYASGDTCNAVFPQNVQDFLNDHLYLVPTRLVN